VKDRSGVPGLTIVQVNGQQDWRILSGAPRQCVALSGYTVFLRAWLLTI
jgi:hypothetical protein